MSKIQIRECLAAHGDELECAVCAPPDRWPHEALILEPGDVLVISMPNLSAEERDEFEASLTKVAQHAGIEGRAVAIYGAEQLAVMKPPPLHPTNRDLNKLEGP